MNRLLKFWQFKKDNDIIILNDYIILNFINSSRGNLRRILKIISERLTHRYITLYYGDCYDIIDKLKSLGFGIKIYDDSNEYSENTDDKVKVSWEYDNTIIDNDKDDDLS